MEVEETSVGYPGFRVARPPFLRPIACLKRVALAKLSGITMFSASFGGEKFLFEPWLTALVDYGDDMAVTGVYRKWPEASLQDPRIPAVCLRKSEWNRNLDFQQACDVENLNAYLASGSQIKNTFVFANRTTHPRLNDVMNTALSILVRGVSVEPVYQRNPTWQYVDVDLGDDRLNCRIDYSLFLARSQSIESALPAWIEEIDELLQEEGLPPDGEITLSITRSVPELVNASPLTPKAT